MKVLVIGATGELGRQVVELLSDRSFDVRAFVRRSLPPDGPAVDEVVGDLRDRESLDRFKDKKRRAYNLQVQRAEQKELDELAIQLSATPGPFHYQTQPGA